MPKELDVYIEFQKTYNIRWYDYKVIIENLEGRINPEMVPRFDIKPVVEKIYYDPVIDPRETWKEYIKRVVEFEDPPLVERNELPEKL